MIDPSIADLMHHLGQPIPALVQQFDRGRLSAPEQAAKLEKDIAEHEILIGEWAATLEGIVHDIVQANSDGRLDRESVRQLVDVVEFFEKDISRLSKIFLQDQKVLRRKIRNLRRSSAADAAFVARLGRRYLCTAAKRGSMEAEFMFALRSVVAETDPGKGAGPVFDDPKALGDYLRAAIA